MIGGCCVKSWSSTQSLIATSSAEAEYYGIFKAASVGLGVQAMLVDLGYQFNLKVITDASAAKAIASRQGLGKTRHIAVHYLWVQQRVKNGDFVVEKCWGGENPADLLTKYLTKSVMSKNMELFGLKICEGRAASAPEVSNIVSVVPCISPAFRW